MRVSQKDIAEALGIAISTVSKALKGDPAIKKNTIATVRAKAQELGYTPDPMLVALSTYRKQNKATRYKATIAWICNYPKKLPMDQFPGHADYLTGATQRANELGYELCPLWNPTGSPTAFDRILKARGIKGLIIAPQANTNTSMSLQWDSYASATIGYTLASPELDRITNDHFSTMADLLTRLQKRQYKKIGCYLWETDNERMGLRAQSAFFSYSKAHNVVIKQYKTFHNEEYLDWLKVNQFDAVIGQGKEQFKIIQANLNKLPKIAYAGYALERSEEEISGMNHNNQQIGASAIEWVTRKLERGQFGLPAISQRLLISSQWLENNTLS